MLRHTAKCPGEEAKQRQVEQDELGCKSLETALHTLLQFLENRGELKLAVDF